VTLLFLAEGGDMFMDDKLFWGFVFSTVSIAIGWSLNQLGQWISVRNEDKRKLKSILYHLLEVHHLFLRSDFGILVKIVKDKIRQLIPAKEFTPEVDAVLTNIFTAFANNLVTKDVLKNFQRLELGYEESIKNLSAVEPLIAYRLSGKTSIYTALEGLSSHVSGLAELLQSDKTKFDKEMKQVVDIMKPDLTKNIIQELENDMLDIALKINLFTWWELKGVLKKYRATITEDMTKEIDALFKQFEHMLKP
jgi:hypothetical protein